MKFKPREFTIEPQAVKENAAFFSPFGWQSARIGDIAFYTPIDDEKRRYVIAMEEDMFNALFEPIPEDDKDGEEKQEEVAEANNEPEEEKQEA